MRCPNCEAQYWLLRQNTPTQLRNADQPFLTGSLADMIDQAMYRSGVLVDARQRTLRALYRMAQDSEDYTSMLVRSTMPKEGDAA